MPAGCSSSIRLTLILGAEPTRLKWGIDLAKEEAEQVGRDPATLKLGAVVSLVAHSDPDVAIRLGGGAQAAMMRESAMFGKIHGPVKPEHQEVIQNIVKAYDLNGHAAVHTPQSQVLTRDFVETFAVVGTPEVCVQRFRELADLGLERFYIATPGGIDANRGATEAERAEAEEIEHHVFNDVLPKVRDMTPAAV
jgi:5,10-methylenetetrahydromethanopterin reductase